jgi:hypothetical protein
MHVPFLSNQPAEAAPACESSGIEEVVDGTAAARCISVACQHVFAVRCRVVEPPRLRVLLGTRNRRSQLSCHESSTRCAEDRTARRNPAGFRRRFAAGFAGAVVLGASPGLKPAPAGLQSAKDTAGLRRAALGGRRLRNDTAPASLMPSLRSCCCGSTARGQFVSRQTVKLVNSGSPPMTALMASGQRLKIR